MQLHGMVLKTQKLYLLPLLSFQNILPLSYFQRIYELYIMILSCILVARHEQGVFLVFTFRSVSFLVSNEFLHKPIYTHQLMSYFLLKIAKECITPQLYWILFIVRDVFEIHDTGLLPSSGDLVVIPTDTLFVFFFFFF
jgi:hypothetical protein